MKQSPTAAHMLAIIAAHTETQVLEFSSQVHPERPRLSEHEAMALLGYSNNARLFERD
jgi:hypothetical protein